MLVPLNRLYDYPCEHPASPSVLVAVVAFEATTLPLLEVTYD